MEQWMTGMLLVMNIKSCIRRMNSSSSISDSLFSTIKFSNTKLIRAMTKFLLVISWNYIFVRFHEIYRSLLFPFTLIFFCCYAISFKSSSYSFPFLFSLSIFSTLYFRSMIFSLYFYFRLTNTQWITSWQDDKRQRKKELMEAYWKIWI